MLFDFIKRCLLVSLFLLLLLPVEPVFATSNTDSLRVYWKFDESSTGGADSVIDSSEDGANGTPDGVGGSQNLPQPSLDVPSSISFTDNHSLLFDGTDDSVTYDGITVPDYPFTMTLWLSHNGGGSRTIAAFRYSVVTNVFYSIWINNSLQINAQARNVADSNATSTTLFNDTTWRHVAAVFTSDTSRTIYVDGVAEATSSVNVDFNTSSNRIQVGRAGSCCFANGKIDDFRFYTRALSQEEITQLASGDHTRATWDGSTSSDTEVADNWNINAIPDLYTNLTIADVANDPVATDNLSLSGLTIDSGGNLSLAGNNLTINDSGAFANNGTLTLQGDEVISNLTSDTDSGKVVYNGSGTYASGLVTGDNYYDLDFTGTGSWTLDANLDVNNDLSISNSGGNLILAGNNLTFNVTGAFSNDGTLTLQGGEVLSDLTNDTDSGTVVYNGTGEYASGLKAGDAYNNLTFNGTGSWTLDNDLDVNQDLTLANGTLIGGSNTITLGDDWIKQSGSFTANTSTVTLDGADGQQISGDNSFYNLTKSVISPQTLTLEADSTQTTTGLLTLGGLASNLLSLRSSVDATAFKIDPQGTRDITYVDVKDSNNINSTAIAYSATNTYGTNLTNWLTALPTPTPSNSSSSTTSSSNTHIDEFCSDSVPVGKPDLFRIDTTENEARLFFTPVSNTSKYFISYSTSSSAQEHGIEINLGSSGVQTYTIGWLSPNTTYYFKIRGQNGCTPGEWSDIKAVKTIGGYQTFIDKLTKPLQDTMEIASLSVESPKVEKEVTETEEFVKTKDDKIVEDLFPEQQTHDVTIKIENEGRPLGGATIELHSNPKMGQTDENGMITFTDVEEGEHTLKIAYQTYQAEQKLVVDGNEKEFNIAIEVNLKEKMIPTWMWVSVIGLLSMVIIFLILRLRVKER